MAKEISLHDEAIATVNAMVVLAEGRNAKNGDVHPIEVWKYILECVKEHEES